ncbi:Protein ssh4, partial [Basidiobolus ranarum]
MLNYLNFPILLLIITIYPDQVEAIGPFSNTALTVILLTVLLVSIVGIFLCRTLGSKCQRESDTLGVSQVEVYDTDPKTIQGSIVPSYWTDADIRSYLLARTFEQQFPPKDPDITSEQFSLINERGVGAWEMEKYSYMNVMIRENTEVTFLSDECCVQSNLPFPQWEDVCYYEVKIFEKPADTMVAIGVASKPYPSWRFPVLNRHSVGYYSTGQKYCNDSFEGKPYGSL